MSEMNFSAPDESIRYLRVRDTTALDNVRRNLYNCTDREENRRFVERELARQREIDSQRWGYDFANEKPLPGAQRFTCQLLPASTVPALLRRSSIPITPNPSSPVKKVKVSSPERNKTQKRITDFLKPCKQLSKSGKKSPTRKHKHDCGHGAHILPPKVERLTQPRFKNTS